MRLVRLSLVTLISLGAIVVGSLWLQRSAEAEVYPGSEAILPPGGMASPGGMTPPLQQAIGLWPPFHENLSRTAGKDSGSADIAAYGDKVVVVWAEGLSARGLNDGLVKLAWTRAQDTAWHTLVVPQPGYRPENGFANYHPAVALSGETAYVVWIREDVAGPGMGNNQVSYAQCNLASGSCAGYAGVTPEDQAYARLAPDVAVDAQGVPHAVWVQQDRNQRGTIWYNNRVGGGWSSVREQVSGGSSSCAYSQDNPTLAVDPSHVYVAWDENVESCVSGGGTAGIYFRLRGNASGAAGSGVPWWPAGTPWGKQLSTAAATTPAKPSEIDGFPTIDVGSGWAYVMWERFAYSETMPFFGAVYTYTLAYRVFTGTLPQEHWWPGGASADRWAAMPFTFTSATDTAEYYEGLRPSLKMTGRRPHVVWHQWTAPTLAAAREEELLQDALVDPLAPLPEEYLVSDQYPYKVSYATYHAGTDPNNLAAAQARWAPVTLRASGQDRILSWADLALASTDGGQTYQLHVALHQRQEFVSADNSYAWDVWYTNDRAYARCYVPLVFKGRRP